MLQLQQFQKIVDSRQFAEIDGVLVDIFSASVVVQVVGALNEANQARLLSFPVDKIVSMAYTLAAKAAA